MNTPLVITGMHRSGTSFVAELFQLGGVHVGDRLFPADAGNPRGYFEDEDFLSLQRRMLADACAPGAEGWPDWGWTRDEHLRTERFDPFTEEMKALAAQHRATPGLWGWKDPRTSLLLDQWHRLLPDARYVLVVREPWLVADSVRRLPAPLFQQDPEVAVRIWMFYNRHLLRFARTHPEHCIILPTLRLNTEPHLLLQRACAVLELQGLHFPAEACREVVRSAVERAGTRPASLEADFAHAHPDAYALWHELLRSAVA